MTLFKHLSDRDAIKKVNQVLAFTNSLPLSGDQAINELLILDNVNKFFNVLLSHSTKKNKLRVEVIFDTNTGKEKVDIIDRSEIILQKLFSELGKFVSTAGMAHQIQASNSLIKNSDIHLFHKTNLIDAENSILKTQIDQFHEYGNETIVREFIELRLELIFNLIYSFEDIKTDQHFNGNLEALYNILRIYLSYRIDFHIYRNQIFQALSFLSEELERNEDEGIRKIFIQRIINLNSHFLLEPQSKYLEMIEGDAFLFSNEEIEFLKMEINANPKNMSVQSMKFGQGTLTAQIVKENPIFTIIRFSLPFGTKNRDLGKIQIDSKTQIEFKSLETQFSDPVYRAFKDWSIGGIGWNFFSDTFQSINTRICTIAFVIEDFYHPDFEFDENGIVENDFSNEKALNGRDFYPHKELIIKTFLKHIDLISEELEISRSDVNINMFSNYIVDYLNRRTNSVVHRKLITITNPDSFSNASNRFIERLNELNLSDSYIPISDLINNTTIVSDKSLSGFIKSLLIIVLKNNIELHGNYRYFWKDTPNGVLIPQSEPDMQPLIMGQLKTICDYMGIQISREVGSGNGEIDFLCSFSYNSKVLKTCVELKNAHSPKYELGLTAQLPQYLKSERTRNGLYLILWYKGDSFDSPKGFQNIEALQLYLDERRPKGYQIDVIIIDCNRPISPSKLK